MRVQGIIAIHDSCPCPTYPCPGCSFLASCEPFSFFLFGFNFHLADAGPAEVVGPVLCDQWKSNPALQDPL